MKTINKPGEPLRQVFQDIPDFLKNHELAFECAEKGDNVEIWLYGDYFTLEYHSLQAEPTDKGDKK